MNIEDQERVQTGQQARKVGNYVIDLSSEIGSGYTSKVYKAKNVLGGAQLAMKVIEVKKLSSPIHKSLLENELRALSELNHPGILKSMEILQTSNNIYIATALYDQNMENYFLTKGRLSENEIIFFLFKMTEALCYLQLNGIIHRDVKLPNIFLAGGQYVLGDLGFCYFVNAPCSEQGYNIGSPLYMSPQAHKSIYSHQSDIWALGVCILQLHLGCRPFIGMTFDQMFYQICQAKFYREFALSNPLKSILDSMLQFDVNKRATPLSLLQKIKESGLIKQYTTYNPIKILNSSNLSRSGLEQLKTHKRSVSIRINQNNPNVNFKNVHRKKISAKKPSNETVRQALIPIENRGIQLRSPSALTQRQRSKNSFNCPKFLKSTNQNNSKIQALKIINDQLLLDQRLCDSLNKIKLSLVLAAVFQTPTKPQVSSKLQLHPPDPYLSYVIRGISSNPASVAQIMHFLGFLAESVLREDIYFMNQIDCHSHSTIRRIGSLERFVILCMSKEHSKQNNKQNSYPVVQLQNSIKPLKNKSKSVGNLKSNLYLHKFQTKR